MSVARPESAPDPGVPAESRVVSASRGPLRRLSDVWRYRELLGNLVRKELKVRYKNSTLGFVWSLLNPALYLVVFWVVFEVFLGAGIPDFPIFLLSGLLAWNLFTAAVGGGCASIVANASLVSRVWFPREVLPLAAVGAAIVHFLLQAVVLGLGLAVFRYTPEVGYLWLVPLALVVLVVLASALAIGLGAMNVSMRDTQHLLEIALLAWFWLTPIVYPFGFVADRLGSLALLNPVTSVVIAIQRALYGAQTAADGTQIVPDASVWWYARNLGIVGGAALVLLFVALAVFSRLEADFAEEI